MEERSTALSLSPHLREETESLISSVGAIVPSTEAEFLELGRHLQDFWERSASLSRLAAECASLTSGEDMERSVSALGRELGRLGDMCRIDSGNDSLQQFERITKVVADLGSVLGDFGRIVRKLQMLGISTRIESARLGNTGRGFNTLADDVEKLGLTIVEHSAKITDKSNILSRHLASARERTATILASQSDCAESLVTTVRTNMDSLMRLAENSRQVAARLPERTAGIESAIAEIVRSLQFHDIVRQQVEHVEHAMRDALEEMGRLTSRSSEEEALGAVSFCADVSEVQLQQMVSARDAFVEAVDSVIANLGEVAGSVHDIVSDIAGSAGDQGADDILRRTGTSIEEVMGGIREFAQQGHSMAETMREVADTVGEMADFVSDIEEVGEEIELIALNASIKAAHTGSEGAALGVLAMAIQALSVEARDKTSRVSDILTTISEVSDRLQSNASTSIKTQEVDGILGKFREMTADIGSTNQKVGSCLDGLSEQGNSLAEDLVRRANEVEFHHRVGDGLHAAEVRTQAMLERIRTELPTMERGRQPERLRAMLDRYTMEAERDVYRKALGGGEAGASCLNEDEDACTGEFGNNVELF
ncbi:methyl-accepting chemotaxis sensory transducer [Desulfovibrio sp. X2]|uniref:methyl-accepting chemotaxis protein n=1 Tax=Desulfovibrio sp. X2 TaxID=941449 RepID=UPI000358ACA3|nr:methyl-accepting chemotaxis protein [Desulfovibrio sp. X2]EPR44117.1 methyl-accepting chemotaxis sensory transducer [Desulfovibrio sp. X2]